MIFTPEVVTLLILNTLFAFFAIIAFVLSLKIFLKWDINSTCQEQYQLEKQSYLAATIIKYIFAIKVPLFLFFIFTLDKISNVLTGAMCGAGVVDATPYGIYLLVLKIINLYLFAYWLLLHKEDIKYENQPYTRMKFGIFVFVFFLFMSELILEGVMFSSIDVDRMVSCCGTLYSSSATSYVSEIFSLERYIVLSLFYGNFLLIVVFYFLKHRYIFAILNIFFILISLMSLIVFFGTYIYELPTHHCPFCFLQKEYFYVGYFLYIFLFIGTLSGLSVGLIEFDTKEIKKYFGVSLVFTALYILAVTLYPLLYFMKNGVWL